MRAVGSIPQPRLLKNRNHRFSKRTSNVFIKRDDGVFSDFSPPQTGPQFPCDFKSVAKMLSEALHCSFLEADDFHSQSNKEKMARGIPLCDKDRVPWLEALRDGIRHMFAGGETIVLACSALQKRYREILRSADPDYRAGEYANCKVKFVCLVAAAETLAERMKRRCVEGGGDHFMPVSLLQSQLDLLQIFEDEGIPQIDSTMNLQLVLNQILNLFEDLWG